MKNSIGRVIAFSVILTVIVSAVGGCDTSSPDDSLLHLYLDAHADELQQPAGDDDTPVNFVVEPGETASVIASRLEQEQLISDAELFCRYVQYHNLDASIEAGEFSLSQTMTIPEIAQALQRAQRSEQSVTIREGLRLEEIAAAVAAQTSIPYDEFLTLVTTGWRDSGFTPGFLNELPPAATLEGFLFPETYRLPEDPTAADLLSRMLATFDARVAPEMQSAAASHGLSLYELITLASIVEREAVLDKERAVIAGVYYNRLEAGWLLSACPTVQYAIGDASEWWPSLTLDDLEFDSPYNTYHTQGLPPGPISNPGIASIRAAAYPADTDYYFFLADCTKDDGSHLFATTEEEHFSNYEMCGGGVP